MIYGIIIAGGLGTRMGITKKPKQFLEIGSKAIILYTIEEFLKNKKVDKIIISVHKEWINYAEKLIEEQEYNTDKIEIIIAGQTRHKTVMRSLEYIEDTYGVAKDDIVVIHDSVRPFVNQRMIDENIEMVKKHNAVNTVIPAIDTIAISDNLINISDIPSREKMFNVQTPQSFKLEKIIEASRKLKDDEIKHLTDTGKIIILNDDKLHMVEGETYNIKITTQIDLIIAEAILKRMDS